MAGKQVQVFSSRVTKGEDGLPRRSTPEPAGFLTATAETFEERRKQLRDLAKVQYPGSAVNVVPLAEGGFACHVVYDG